MNFPIRVITSHRDNHGALWQLWAIEGGSKGYAVVSLERPNNGAEYPPAEVATAAEWFVNRVARFDRDGYAPAPVATDDLVSSADYDELEDVEDDREVDWPGNDEAAQAAAEADYDRWINR